MRTARGMGNPVLFEPAPAEAHTQRLDVSAATQSSGSAPLEDAPLRGEPWPSALEARRAHPAVRYARGARG